MARPRHSFSYPELFFGIAMLDVGVGQDSRFETLAARCLLKEGRLV